jgi:YjbE family integral membrane protein
MIDMGWFGSISFDLAFLSALFSIIVINLILSGDNAVVIALACQSLPKKQKFWGIVLGSAAAVVLRIILTFFAAQLLLIPYLKLAGGILIAWIAVKLFLEGTDEAKCDEAGNLWQAVKIILIADLVMSIDNVLAVAGASKGNMFLLIFGLGTSIPLVVGTSTLLSVLMEKYPIIIYIGAAVLGKVAGELIITDPFVEGILHPTTVVQYVVEAVFAVGVIVVGKLWLKWKTSKEPVEKACAKPTEGA